MLTAWGGPSTACALPGDVLLGRAPVISLRPLPCGSSQGWHAGFGALRRRGFAPGVLLPGCVSAALVQKVSDELVKRPHAPGGRKGKQLQEKEQIPLSHLMIFLCVSMGAGALARSVALFSEMLCS